MLSRTQSRDEALFYVGRSLIDEATSIPANAVLERDVCVIGGGAAGLSVALELEASGHSVCVVESGGFEHEEEVQSLYRGAAPEGTLASYPDYLFSGRLRFLGGTTNHWAGFCARLDPVDFSQRDWVPDSGWPIGPSSLDPFYDRAAVWLQIPPPPGPHLDLEHRPLATTAGIETHIYALSPPTRFGVTYREQLARSRKLEVILHANAVNLAYRESTARVESVKISTLDGHRFSVRARCVVLAAGAIENARLLLVSNDVVTAGLGNDHDLVGRYFLEHFYATEGAGYGFFVDAPEALTLYTRSLASRYVGVFGLSRALQREHELLNHQIRLFLHRGSMETAQAFYRAVGQLATQISIAAGRGISDDSPERHIAFLQICSEIAPSPQNRVYLTDDVDGLGLRRVGLRCSLGALERDSIERTLLLFARLIGRSHLGRVRLNLASPSRWDEIEPGYHQMGTTRMHADARRGVVNENCRVHGVENLFVAGSSVFPTAGRVNPTFTLVALAIRIADRLKEVLRK